MNSKLSIKQSALAQAQTDSDYLQVILQKYNAIWSAEPNKLTENFSDEQISLLIYGILHNQVYNGGFLQLIHNGYTSYVFNSPLTQSLKEWGAISVAELLINITDRCVTVSSELQSGDKTLEALSDSYSKYPDFDNYDNQFYNNDGTKEIRAYLSAHLSDFISIE